LEELYALGALDEDGTLTKPLGESLARLPVEPTMGKVLIVAAQSGGCASAALAVVAMDSTDTIFSTSRYSGIGILTYENISRVSPAVRNNRHVNFVRRMQL